MPRNKFMVIAPLARSLFLVSPSNIKVMMELELTAEMLR